MAVAASGAQAAPNAGSNMLVQLLESQRFEGVSLLADEDKVRPEQDNTDVTEWIVNPDFSDTEHPANGWNGLGDGEVINGIAQKWVENAGWAALWTVSQEVTDLPNGIYKLYDIYCEFDQETDYYYCIKIKENEYNITGLNPNTIKINEELARLKLLLKIPGVKEYFKEKGYATQFLKSKHILLPNVFYKIYLGALGECIGEFLLNQHLMQFNMKLERINSIEKYEKFDFVIENDIYVDFKHWSGITDKDRDTETERFIKKLDKINGKIGFIINILKPINYNPKQYISNDNRLIIIPYLYDSEMEKFNLEAFKSIIWNIKKITNH